MDGSGNFVVAWQSDGQDGSGNGIYAQRYDSSGSAVGSEFLVNTYTTSAQGDPSSTMDGTGLITTSRRGRSRSSSRSSCSSLATEQDEGTVMRAFM